MPHFPMFVDLSGRPVLIVGGGSVALRKLRKLAPYGPKCVVVAPEVAEEIRSMDGVQVCRRPFPPMIWNHGLCWSSPPRMTRQ